MTQWEFEEKGRRKNKREVSGLGRLIDKGKWGTREHFAFGFGKASESTGIHWWPHPSRIREGEK